MNPRPSCWIAPTLIGRFDPERGEYAVYARQPIEPGELLAVFGGDIVPGCELSSGVAGARRYALQVDEDLFVVSSSEGPGDWFNHACEPNAGLRGQLSLVALRSIEVGEEVRYDYAMTDGSPYDEFSCACGSELCRRNVTGDDWRRAELWLRYRGHFSPYLQLRIDQLIACQPSPVEEPALVLRVHAPKAVARRPPRRSRPAASRPSG